MAITEEKYYEAFGLEMPTPESAAEAEVVAVQELAAPDPADAAAEENNKELDNEPSAVSADPEGMEQEGSASPQNEKKPLTAEQRRENAARRRQQEQQARQAEVSSAVNAAVQAERARAEAEMNAFFATAGLKNSYTGKPITNMEEFKSWENQSKSERLQKDLQAGRLTQEGLAQAISEHPAVQAAQELVRRAEADAKTRQQEQDRAVIDAELARINARDPSIKTVADLLKMPNAEEFRALVRRGYTFEDAHYLVNREKLEQAAAEAIRQKTLNDTRGKAHLTGTGATRGTGTAAVPQAEMELYRRFNPHATEEQIRAHYNKYLKK